MGLYNFYVPWYVCGIVSRERNRNRNDNQYISKTPFSLYVDEMSPFIGLLLFIVGFGEVGIQWSGTICQTSRCRWSAISRRRSVRSDTDGICSWCGCWSCWRRWIYVVKWRRGWIGRIHRRCCYRRHCKSSNTTVVWWRCSWSYKTRAFQCLSTWRRKWVHHNAWHDFFRSKLFNAWFYSIVLVTFASLWFYLLSYFYAFICEKLFCFDNRVFRKYLYNVRRTPVEFVGT